MTAASIDSPCGSCIAGTDSRAERLMTIVRPMLPGKKRASAPGEPRRGKGPGTYAQTVEITSGTSILQQGLAATCKDSLYRPRPKSARGVWWGA